MEPDSQNAARVTPQLIDDSISEVYYFTAMDGVDGYYCDGMGAQACKDWASLHLLTFCVLVLKNGFTVTGESACVSPENFDAEIGRQIAYKNAREKVWPLEGYLLREKLHTEKGDS